MFVPRVLLCPTKLLGIGQFQYQELSFSMNHGIEEGRIPLIYLHRAKSGEIFKRIL